MSELKEEFNDVFDETEKTEMDLDQTVEDVGEETLEENDCSEENEEESEVKKNKSPFKKKEKKDKKDEMIDELNDRLLRLMAEFDNYRKRTDKEKSQMFEIGAKDIVEKVLPVVDNFERGLAVITDEEKELASVQGFEKIYKQLVDSLESAGVKAIEAIGQEFNPDLHDAVMHCEDDAYGENVIAEELLKGYMYRDSVVRYSMVKVAN